MNLTKNSDNLLYYKCQKNPEQHKFRYNIDKKKWEKIFTQTKILLHYRKNPIENQKPKTKKTETKPNQNQSIIKISDLSNIKGIGSKRAKKLEIAGVKTASDLAKRSPKHLAEKTSLPIEHICKWIIDANKLTDHPIEIPDNK
jgi:predicted flap endonuclease-1-like 5' DNA nuclease